MYQIIEYCYNRLAIGDTDNNGETNKCWWANILS